MIRSPGINLVKLDDVSKYDYLKVVTVWSPPAMLLKDRPQVRGWK